MVVSGRSSSDDGSKKSAGRAVEELGGYLCDGKQQVARSPVRSPTGQTSEGSLREWHAPFWRWDTPLRMHTDCEWVETWSEGHS